MEEQINLEKHLFVAGIRRAGHIKKITDKWVYVQCATGRNHKGQFLPFVTRIQKKDIIRNKHGVLEYPKGEKKPISWKATVEFFNTL